MSKEGVLEHQEHSPTAATVGNRLYPDSGEMTYRVMVSNGRALFPADVVAKTGDEAAEKAIAANPGCLVASVNPAPQKQAA